MTKEQLELAIREELAKEQLDLTTLDLLYGELYPVCADGTRVELMEDLGGVEVKFPEA